MSGRRVLVVLLCVVYSASAFPQAKWKPALGIVGGNVTDITKVPYQVAALDPSSHYLFCAASIISKNHLLTAGHCCFDEFVYRVGSSDYRKGGTLVESKRRILHPKYMEDFYYPDYDACIVETREPLRFGRKVRPVAISKRLPKPDDIVMAAGWGVTETGQVSEVLRSVKVPVTNATYCRHAYPMVEDMSHFICAGAKGKDSCYGDSGGGLTWKGKLVGIVSFGRDCGLDGFPGVYTNVLSPEIREFIRNVTGI